MHTPEADGCHLRRAEAGFAGHVVEVAGEAGAGKTQFGLQLSICAALATIEEDEIVLYIATGGEGINYHRIVC